MKPAGAVKLAPHTPRKMRSLPWLVCSACGLVYLRNERTKKAIQEGHWIYEDER